MEYEDVCAKLEDVDLDDALDEATTFTCITHHPGFQAVCLNRHTLDTAYNAYRQQWGDYPNGNKAR